MKKLNTVSTQCIFLYASIHNIAELLAETADRVDVKSLYSLKQKRIITMLYSFVHFASKLHKQPKIHGSGQFYLIESPRAPCVHKFSHLNRSSLHSLLMPYPITQFKMHGRNTQKETGNQKWPSLRTYDELFLN